MGVRCCVIGCDYIGTDGLHAFPSKLNQRLEWIRKTKVFHLDETKIHRSWSKVCKSHFTENDYETTYKGKLILKKMSFQACFCRRT